MAGAAARLFASTEDELMAASVCLSDITQTHRTPLMRRLTALCLYKQRPNTRRQIWATAARSEKLMRLCIRLSLLSFIL